MFDLLLKPRLELRLLANRGALLGRSFDVVFQSPSIIGSLLSFTQVCEVLGEKAMGTIDDTKWVVASRLRDHLLLPSERKSVALWKEVKTEHVFFGFKCP